MSLKNLMGVSEESHPMSLTNKRKQRDHLVSRSLGGKSVKCAVSENEHLFTSDMETLLSSLNTEHPEVELVIQALQSFKSQYGEGVKCFLFFITRIWKAVMQLKQLGIDNDISTPIMQEAINQLTEEVKRISMPVVTNYKDKSVCDETVQQKTNDNLEPEEFLSQILVCSKGDACEHTHGEYIVDSPTNDGLSSVMSEVTPHNMQSLNNHSNNIDLTVNSLRQSKEVNIPLSDKVSQEMLETDVVFLKMINLPKIGKDDDGDEDDDINWFFGDMCNEESLKKLHRDNKRVGQSNSNRSSDYLKTPVIHSSTDQDPSLMSLCDNDQFDSEFEDCFDDVVGRKRVTVVEEFVNRDQSELKSNQHKQDKNDCEKRMQHNIQTHFVQNGFEEPSVFIHSLCKSNHRLTNDEFSDCFDKEPDKMMKDLDKVSHAQLTVNENKTSPQNANFIDADETETKIAIERTANVDLKNDMIQNEDPPLSFQSQITKLNSLLKQTGLGKKHDAQQFIISSRHDLNEHSSYDNIIKHSNIHASAATVLSSPKLNRKDATQTQNIAPEVVTDCKDMNADFSQPVFAEEQTSGTSEIAKMNTLLKRLSEKKSSTKMAQVIISSRHMSDPVDLKQTETITSGKSLAVSDKTISKSNTPKDLDGVGLSREILGSQGKDKSQCYDLGKDNNIPTLADDLKLISDCHHFKSGDLLRQKIVIPKDVICLGRDSDELMELVGQVYCLQLDNGGEFDINKFHCVSNQSSRCFKKVLNGLIIRSTTQVMEEIGSSSEVCTLLVNGDLKSSYAHKGYKPIAKRLVVESSVDHLSMGKELKWASKVLSVIKKLNIGLLMVKGRVSDMLLDKLMEENITVLSSVPYRVLEIVSHILRVRILSYVHDAEKANICQLSFKPLDECWMDRCQDSHCLIITNITCVQTIVLQLPDQLSCQVEEEKVWKCFHRLHNALKDGSVLPGCGWTEAWCEKKLRLMGIKRSESSDGSLTSSLLKSVVITALAEIFQDYVSTIRLNAVTTDSEGTHRVGIGTHSQNAISSNSLTDHWDENFSLPVPGTRKYYMQQLENLDELEKVNDVRINSAILTGDGCGIKSKKTESTHGFDYSGIFDVKEEILSKSQGYHYISHCDTLSSKVSAWFLALDLVQVLLSVDSLVITGASASDLDLNGVLL